MALTAEQKLAFVHKMTHMALTKIPHFDQGGPVAPELQGQIDKINQGYVNDANKLSQGSVFDPGFYSNLIQNEPENQKLRTNQIAQATANYNNVNNPTLTGPVQAGNGQAVDTNANGLADAFGTGNKFKAGYANLNPGTNLNQLNTAYTQAQNGIGGANNLAGTLAPGVGTGVNSQQFLTNQLMNQAQGIGPNPAQAALNLNTGNNIAAQAALMAGQRGAGANAGLLASQAAQTGAGIQQNAIGQGAALQAQQQLNAQTQLGGLAAQQIGQGTQGVQLQNQSAQNEQNILQGANTNLNNANVGMQENVNNVNAGVAQANANANQGLLGGIGQAIGSVGSFLAGLAEGGVVPPHLQAMAEIYHPTAGIGGGFNAVQGESPINPGAQVQLPQYNGPSFGQGLAANLKAPAKAQNMGPGGQNVTIASPQVAQAQQSQNSTLPLAGTQLPFQSTPGLGQQQMAPASGISPYKSGGKVPGKAKVNHNDYGNDTVPAMLSPGEVVIPLDTLKDKGKIGQMARFLAQEIERKKAGRKLV